MNSSRTIYLEFDEEVLSALAKIKHAGVDSILLVAPKGGRILHSVTGLKLLRDQSERMGKRIRIATADERGKSIAERAGIEVVPASAVYAPSVRRAGMRRPGMGDIRMRTRSLPKPESKADGETAEKEAKSHPDPVTALIAPIERPTMMHLPIVAQRPRRKYAYWVIGGAACLLALSAVAWFVLPSAEIVVKARSEPITRDMEIQVDSAKSAPDIQNLVVPGKKVTEELTDSKTYTATGAKNVGEKASGFVTIYNFSKNSLVLKKATTYLEVGGKKYYFLTDMGSIRPTARIGQDLEVDPSSLLDPVPIAAEAPGENFNLPEGTRFEIFNEVFGHQSAILFAMNEKPIAGGNTKQVKIVSAGDIDAARKDLTGVLADKMSETVKSKLSSDSVLAANAFSSQVLEENISKPVGTETETFDLRQKVRMNALVYNDSDVRDIMVERIVRYLPENQSLPEATAKTVKAVFGPLDIITGIGTLKAHFESEILYRVNPQQLAPNLRGKSVSEVKEILLSRPEIQNVSVNLSPFYIRSVPRFGGKVDVRVEY